MVASRLYGEDSMLTTSRKQSMRRRGAKWLAVFAAVLLLFARSAAAAHYHPWLAAAHPSLAAGASAESGPCALCLLACHFPGNTSAAPAAMQPRPALNAALPASPDRALATGRSPAQTRAPPSIA
jgi:hypothetical protein